MKRYYDWSEVWATIKRPCTNHRIFYILRHCVYVYFVVKQYSWSGLV